MKYLILIAALNSGCACFSIETGFGMDGKAVSSCKRGKLAEEYCGKKPYKSDYYGLQCFSKEEIVGPHGN